MIYDHFMQGVETTFEEAITRHISNKFRP